MHNKKTATAIRLALAASIAATAAQAQQPAKVEKIEVTGSNIRRIEGESALPVTVITREDIQRSGAQTAYEVIQNLPLSNGGPSNELRAVGNSVPLSGASLRGLGSTATLVLLDGRRMSNFAYSASSVDLTSIPIAAIERVEVLRDGASAIYGSDAIAGVINFILRKDFTGLEVSALLAEPEQGGAREKRYTLTAGYGNPSKNGFNAFFTIDRREQSGLMLADRDFSRTSFFPALGVDGRSPNGNPGSYSFVNAPNTFFPAPNCPPDRAVATGFCVQDVTPLAAMVTPTTKTTYFGRLTWNFGNHTLYGEAMYGENEIENMIAPTPLQLPTATAFRMPANSPYNPFGREIIVRWRTTQLGPRTSEIITEASRYLVGLTGQIRSWDYNIGAGSTRSEAESTFTSGYLSTTAVRAGLASGRINGLGDTSAQDFSVLQGAQVAGKTRQSTAKTDYVDGKISGELWQLPAGPLGVAVGFERRRESIDDTPSAFVQSGDVVGGVANQPIGGSRNATALYIEANLPILKSLEINPAVRYDDYSDFGNSTNPKVGLRWQPNKSFLVRTAWGTGFRAPGLNQLYLPTVSAFSATRDNDPLRCNRPGGLQIDCNNQMRTQSGGNPGLRPEESEQFSLGLVWEPLPGLSAEVTYWKINKRQDITTLSVTTILNNIGRFGSLVVREAPTQQDISNGLPGVINFIRTDFQNVGNTRVTGYDFDLRYRFPNVPELGRFTLTTASTYLQRYRSQLDGITYSVMEGRFINLTPLPQWRHTVTLAWERTSWSASVRYNFIDDYEDNDVIPARGQRGRVGVHETVDVQASYSGFKNFRVTLGVKNLTDRNPPFSLGSTFAPGWDNLTHDPRGRIYYGSLIYAFK